MEAPSSPDVSVVVVSYNTRDLLAACLRSLPSAADGVSYEVFVVDNASSDGSPEMVAEQFPSAKLIRNDSNRGFAAANNQALRLARGRYCLLLNSDAQPLPGAITALVRFLDSDHRVGIAGGRLLNPDGTFQASYYDFPGWLDEVLMLTTLSRWLRPPAFPSHEEPRSLEACRADWVNGAFLMARREAIDAVGLLDEDYFMYAEEMDWCHRMRQSGWEVAYVPEARVLHWGGRSATSEPERRRAQVYRGKWLFMRKHRGGVAAASFRAAVYGATVLKLVARLPGMLSSNPVTRAAAMSQVRSYRYLLTHD